MRWDAKTYVIAYDIPHDRRRAHVADLLLSYGHRLQESVFIANVRAAAFIRLKDDLLNMIDVGEDSLLICDMGVSDETGRRLRQYGRGYRLEDDQTCVF